MPGVWYLPLVAMAGLAVAATVIVGTPPISRAAGVSSWEVLRRSTRGRPSSRFQLARRHRPLPPAGLTLTVRAAAVRPCAPTPVRARDTGAGGRNPAVRHRPSSPRPARYSMSARRMRNGCRRQSSLSGNSPESRLHRALRDDERATACAPHARGSQRRRPDALVLLPSIRGLDFFADRRARLSSMHGGGTTYLWRPAVYVLEHEAGLLEWIPAWMHLLRRRDSLRRRSRGGQKGGSRRTRRSVAELVGAVMRDLGVLRSDEPGVRSRLPGERGPRVPASLHPFDLLAAMSTVGDPAR